MASTNRQQFDDLAAANYFKSVEQAAKQFGEIGKYPGSLGFDETSGGFLALHRQHSPSAFDKEIPVCLVLKNLGFRVVLEAEHPNRGTPDALIDDQKFEIKQVARAQNFKRAIEWHFRSACHKSSRLLLHIAQPANESQLRGAIRMAAVLFPAIKIIWVVRGEALFQFERAEVLKNRHCFS